MPLGRRYMTAMRMPQGTPEEKAARETAMQAGLKEAVEVGAPGLRSPSSSNALCEHTAGGPVCARGHVCSLHSNGG